jgi:hypothetical protein
MSLTFKALGGRTVATGPESEYHLETLKGGLLTIHRQFGDN